MAMTVAGAKEFLHKHDVRFVLAQFVDLHGVAKTKAVPVEHFEDVVLQDGAGFAGFAVWGLGQEPHSPDYMAVGDLATLTLVPWQPGFARIVCDGRVKDAPWPLDTRYVLKQQIARLTARRWTLNTGLEPEFMLLMRDAAGRPVPADVTDALDKPCYDYKGLSRSSAFIEKLVAALQAAGFDVYQVDHEDANGQFEINFTYADALTTADRMIFFRKAASEVARQCGVICSFMPKPMSDRTGSGMHMHLSYHLSSLCRSVRDNNRSSMVRVPYGRLELRLIDSAANPYLATAAVIAAGLDGVDRQVDPGEPHNVNLYALGEGELRERGIRVLPQSLVQALEALEADQLFRDTLGAPLLDEFVHLKRMEWTDYHRHVSDWEVKRYLEFF